MMNKTNPSFTLKSLNADGVFSGYASVFDVVDHHKDVMKRGAFARTLKAWENGTFTPKMLWQHDPSQIIGEWTHMEERLDGLWVQGRLFLDLAKANEAYTLLKAGALDSLSIGFMPLRTLKRGANRDIVDLELLEISLVTFAANPGAKVVELKADSTLGRIRKLQGMMG